MNVIFFLNLEKLTKDIVLDTQQITINNTSNEITDYRDNKKDGLAISREIFRNITKKLRENFNSEVIADVNHQKMKGMT